MKPNNTVYDVVQTKTDMSSLSVGSMMIGGLFLYVIYHVCKSANKSLEKRLDKLEKRMET